METLPTHIFTLPFTSLRLFCTSYFELLILATEQVSNTQGILQILVRNTSITCIKYTFVHIAILLIRQVFRAVPLLVTIPFAVEPLGLRLILGPALGFFTGVATCLPFFLKFPFFPLPFFLKLVVLFNHQHLMLFLDFYLRRFQHHEELGNHFRHPLHIIVHHEVPVTW